MYVQLGATGNLLISNVVSPDLRVCEVEPLLGTESVNWSRMMSIERVLECCVGNAESTVVSDVLSERKCSVCMNARQNLHLIKLLYEHCGLRLESHGIFGSPPVGHVSVLVE